MKNKKQITQLALILFFTMFSIEVVANTPDVFTKVGDKATEFLNGVTTLILVFGAIALAIVGFMWFKGRVPANYLYGVLGGILLASFASEVVGWIVA